MTTVQAAVGIEQLKKQKYLNNLRKKTAKKYFEAIENTDIFEYLKNSDHAFKEEPSATPISKLFNFFDFKLFKYEW